MNFLSNQMTFDASNQEPSFQQQEADDARMVMNKRREMLTLSIRKSKRDELVNRKRQLQSTKLSGSQQPDSNTNSEIYTTAQLASLPFAITESLDSFETIKAIQENLSSLNLNLVAEEEHRILEQFILNPTSPQDLLIVFRKLRHLITSERVYIADINLNLTEKLLAMLKQLHIYPMLIFEACLLLFHISSGTRQMINSIVNAGGITHIQNVFTNYEAYPLIQETIIEIIGNIVQDSTSNRNVVLRSGVLDLVISSRNLTEMNYFSTVVWALSNVCCVREYCMFPDLLPFLPIFFTAAISIPNADNQLLSNALLSLSILAKQATRLDQLEEICSTKMAQAISFGMSNKNLLVRERTLRIILNLANKIEKPIVLAFFENYSIESFLFTELQYPKKSKNKQNEPTTNQMNQNVADHNLNPNNNGMELFTNNSNSIESNIFSVESKSNKKATRKYALQAIYSLIKENPHRSYVESILNKYPFFKIIIRAISTETYQNNILDGLYILESLLFEKQYEIIDQLIQENLFGALYYVLDYEQADILETTLKLIYDLLKEIHLYFGRSERNTSGSANQSNTNTNADSSRMIDDTKILNTTFELAVDAIQNAGVLQKIVDLQGNRSKDVSETSMDILDTFFPDLN